MNDSVTRGSAPLSSPCHRTPDNFLGGIRNVRCLINNGGILSSQLQQYRSEVFSSRSHHYLAHTYASREKYEIKRKLQEIRHHLAVTEHSAQSFRLEILGNQFQEQLIRRAQRLREL